MYSVDAAPLWPELKLSMKRTHRRSRGTVVPPDVTHTILLSPKFPANTHPKNHIQQTLVLVSHESETKERDK